MIIYFLLITNNNSFFFPASHNFITISSIMSLLYTVPKSRGSNRNYMGNSVNRRNDTNLNSQNYNNYYGTPSLSKDFKTSSINSPSYPSTLSSGSKEIGILPKINQPEKRDD